MSDAMQMIRDAVRDGKLSAEQGARLMELRYEIARFARRERLKRTIKRWLTAPLRWLCGGDR